MLRAAYEVDRPDVVLREVEVLLRGRDDGPGAARGTKPVALRVAVDETQSSPGSSTSGSTARTRPARHGVGLATHRVEDRAGQDPLRPRRRWCSPSRWPCRGAWDRRSRSARSPRGREDWGEPRRPGSAFLRVIDDWKGFAPVPPAEEPVTKLVVDLAATEPLALSHSMIARFASSTEAVEGQFVVGAVDDVPAPVQALLQVPYLDPDHRQPVPAGEGMVALVVGGHRMTHRSRIP